MPPTSTIAQTIEQLREQYIAQGLAPDSYQINNGLCEDYAIDLMDRLAQPKGMEMLYNENFMNPDQESWDWPLLAKHWNIHPPRGLTAEQVDAISFGGACVCGV